MARAHHVPALRLVIWPGDRARVVDEIGDAHGIGVPRPGGLEDRRLGAVAAERAAHARGHEVHVARQALGTAEVALVETDGEQAEVERVLLEIADHLGRVGRVARREEVVDHHDAVGVDDAVGELELAIDRGAGVLAVDMEPAHRLVHGLQVELGRQVGRRPRQRHDVGRLHADRADGAMHRLLVEPEVAQIELLATLAIGGEHRRRAAAPHADLEQVARDPGLLVEQGAPDAVGLEHEPARNGVDLFPTEHR